MPRNRNVISVGFLRDQLAGLPADKPLVFGTPDLEFYRVKDRGDAVQIEFSQTVYTNAEGRVVVNDHLWLAEHQQQGDED